MAILYQSYKRHARVHIYRKRSTIRPTLLSTSSLSSFAKNEHLRHDVCRCCCCCCCFETLTWSRAFATKIYAYGTNASSIVESVHNIFDCTRAVRIQNVIIWRCVYVDAPCHCIDVSIHRKWDIIAHLWIAQAKIFSVAFRNLYFRSFGSNQMEIF